MQTLLRYLATVDWGLLHIAASVSVDIFPHANSLMVKFIVFKNIYKVQLSVRASVKMAFVWPIMRLKLLVFVAVFPIPYHVLFRSNYSMNFAHTNARASHYCYDLLSNSPVPPHLAWIKVTIIQPKQYWFIVGILTTCLQAQILSRYGQ